MNYTKVGCMQFSVCSVLNTSWYGAAPVFSEPHWLPAFSCIGSYRFFPAASDFVTIGRLVHSRTQVNQPPEEIPGGLPTAVWPVRTRRYCFDVYTC